MVTDAEMLETTEKDLRLTGKAETSHRSPLWLFPAATRKGSEYSLETDAGPIHRSRLQGACCRRASSDRPPATFPGSREPP
jgi:hypothetical protein